jgi:small subunit ribosomal protein S4e
MVKRHLKRLNAPKTWKIQRRGITFITRNNPGGSPQEFTTSISSLLKYDLGMAHSMKEVKHIIKEGEILVNNVKISDYRYPVGFTDVVTFPKLGQNYRLIIDVDNILKLVPISKEEAGYKILKIIGKHFVKGKTQLNLMDGRNIMFEKQHYKVNDALYITFGDGLVKEHLPLEKGMLALLYKGKHVGKIGTLENIKGDSVTLKTSNGNFETKKEYVLIVGKDKPLIKMTK